ncbi:MAG: flavodoxin domain-containing protein [Bacteroidales bacterium]|nr:flavodoxin domain-containing protein [Bacteroidales bacterium]
MNIVIIYNSKQGTTRAYAGEIADYLQTKGQHNVKIFSIEDADTEAIDDANVILIGSWTSGLYFFGQKPDKKWKQFAKSLPELNNKTVGFFTTYKLLTGSMFKNMNKHLKTKLNSPVDIFLKSRNSSLTDENKISLNHIV